MKILQWIGMSLAATMFFVACNMDNNTDNEPMVETDDVEVNERDRLFSDWDTDQNDGISRNEFDESFDNESFDRWDRNRDGLLDNDEYGEGVFDQYDRDHSGSLTDNERNTIWDDKEGANIADWDRDGNKEMDREEFRQIFSMENDLSEWDDNGDGKLDNGEYTIRMYRLMDTNKDGLITHGEFNYEEVN